METVHVRIGTDNHLAPAKLGNVKGRKLLGFFALHLHTTAQHLHQIGDDGAGENFGVICLQAVENLSAHRHNPLELCIPGQLDASQCGIALHDIQLPDVRIPTAAVHKFLHPVGDIHLGGKIFLDIALGFFRAFPGPLVNQHLLGSPVRILLVFNKPNLQLLFEERRHGLLGKFAVDALFGLVFKAADGGETVGHHHQTVLNILENNLIFIFGILVGIP